MDDLKHVSAFLVPREVPKLACTLCNDQMRMFSILIISDLHCSFVVSMIKAKEIKLSSWKRMVVACPE